MEEIKKWWEDNAFDFQEEKKIIVDVNYGPGCPNEDNLNLLGDVSGKAILEIGCGGTQCGIALAKQGARVVGMDISENELKFAKNLAEENNVEIEFLQGGACDLSNIESDSKDIVFSSYALMYFDDLGSCFKHVFRVLRKGGIFVFSNVHPFWQMLDKKEQKVNRSYFDPELNQESHGKGIFMEYRRKLSVITDALLDSGLVIERIIEPNGGLKYKEDFWFDNYPKYKQEAMKNIPRSIIFKARKIN